MHNFMGGDDTRLRPYSFQPSIKRDKGQKE